jgi:hypothetical protein
MASIFLVVDVYERDDNLMRWSANREAAQAEAKRLSMEYQKQQEAYWAAHPHIATVLPFDEVDESNWRFAVLEVQSL